MRDPSCWDPEVSAVLPPLPAPEVPDSGVSDPEVSMLLGSLQSWGSPPDCGILLTPGFPCVPGVPPGSWSLCCCGPPDRGIPPPGVLYPPILRTSQSRGFPLLLGSLLPGSPLLPQPQGFPFPPILAWAQRRTASLQIPSPGGCRLTDTAARRRFPPRAGTGGTTSGTGLTWIRRRGCERKSLSHYREETPSSPRCCLSPTSGIPGPRCPQGCPHLASCASGTAAPQCVAQRRA